MKKLKLQFLGIFLLLSIKSFGQNGTYICHSQEFTNEADDSQNKLYSDRVIITIDFYDFGGNLKINYPSKEVLYNWNIKKKLNVEYDRERRIVYTSYFAFMAIGDIEGTKSITIILIEGIDQQSITIAIGDDGVYNWYHNLEKL